MTDPDREHPFPRAATGDGKSPDGIIRPDEDAWPRIAAEVEAVKGRAFAMLHHPDMLDLMERRFREGQETFGDQWLSRPLEWFTSEAFEEAADLLMYLAMRRVIGEV